MFAYSGRMGKLISLFAILVIGVLLAFAGCQASRSGYKSAPYVIVRSEGDFELRDYPELMLAETTMKEGAPAAASTASSDSSPAGTGRSRRFP